MDNDIILFENYFDGIRLYRGISKKELIKACEGEGTLLYTSADNRVSLTTDIDVAKDHSNYVVEVDCPSAEKISDVDFKSESPEDCTILKIYEFDTKGNELDTYSLDEFLSDVD